MYSTSGDWYFKSTQGDKDIIFQGVDGSSQITALTLDMSDFGGAIFNSHVTIPTIAYVGTSIVHNGDANTSLDFGTDSQTFYAGGVRALDLNTGGVVFNEGSADVDFRVESNGSTYALFVDGGANHVNIMTSTDLGAVLNVSGNAYIQHADNSDTLTLECTDADANVGPNLRLYRNSSSPADDDFLGQIDFEGRNDNSGDFTAARIFTFVKDVTAGSEDAQLQIGMMKAGAIHLALEITPDEFVINNSSVDIDFRVESNGNANMLVVDGGDDSVRVGGTTGESGDTFSVLESGANVVNSRFRNANADANGVRVTFEKASASPANNDEIAQLDFMGRDSAGNSELYAGIQAFIDDVTSGTEDGVLRFGTISAGSYRNRLDILPTETVFNQDSIDLDFRVESDDEAYALFVDGGNDAVCIGKSSDGLTEAGSSFSNLQSGGHHYFAACNTEGTAGNAVVYLNRQSADGTLIEFRQANTAEGTITVSGSTVALNGFSGRHESSGIATNTAVGTVVSTIDELDVYPNTQLDPEGGVVANPKAGQTRADHAKVKVSDAVGDACVYGVVAEFTAQDKVIVTSVGIGSVKVTGACAKGDLLESNGDGTAKVQSDDIIRSKTIGKVTIGNSTAGVKLVSCVLYCG